ncbi:hypothetical protein GDO78_010462 [Eleutherodactylus coqui]|uniref:Uncharacterized protein n=1 Tax=Eleutherodactylus coqui TaxID=57060 RepID=A0A8J6F671_ELECQ|nr:hypothetical protein GDO78_010462 [Eleutherodactylus coqui]
MGFGGSSAAGPGASVGLTSSTKSRSLRIDEMAEDMSSSVTCIRLSNGFSLGQESLAKSVVIPKGKFSDASKESLPVYIKLLEGRSLPITPGS